MRKFMLVGALSLFLGTVAAWAGPACTAVRPDISLACATTPVADCVDADNNSVTVQIGGLGAINSDEDGPTCQGTAAVVLVTFTKLPGDMLQIEVDNRTCDDNASLTALFHNITTSVTGYTPVSLAALSGVVDEAWFATYEQTLVAHDGLGTKADGFGSFDAAIYNGDSSSPTGGNKLDIQAGEVFEFVVGVTPGFDLCDFLTELSTPPPGHRNRNVVGRFQACGPDEQNSAFIGPCDPDGQLLAVIDEIQLTPGDNDMLVEWSTSLEIQNAGFNVLRREATRGGWEKINVSLLPGQGDTVSGADYSFIDATAHNGVEYVYRIEDIDFSGKNDLSETRKDVTNPPAPMVNLTEPAYGATVDLNSRPRFSFRDNGVNGRLTMQFSSDPLFAEGSTVSTHVPGRFGVSGVTLYRGTARRVSDLAAANDGIVYWRVVDWDRVPVSDTFRMEIQNAGGPGSNRAGVSR